MADPRVRVRFTAKDETGPAVTGIRKAIGGLKGLAAGLAASFAGIGLSRFLLDSVEAAAEADGIWRRLGTTVERAGVDFKAVRPELERMGAAFQAATRFDDEGFADALGTILGLTGDYAQSLEAVNVAADLAIKHNKSLEESALLVGKALTGSTETLGRFGIQIDKTGDVLAQLRAQTQGFAEADGKTLIGTLTRIRNGWDNVKQALGDAIANGDGATDAMGGLVGRLVDLEAWIKDNRQGIQDFVNLVLDGASAFLTLAANIGSAIRKLNDWREGLRTDADREFLAVVQRKARDFEEFGGGVATGVDLGADAGLAQAGRHDAPRQETPAERDARIRRAEEARRATEEARKAAEREAARVAKEARERLEAVIEDARVSAFPQDLAAGQTQGRFDQMGVRVGAIEAAGAPLQEALTGLSDQGVWEQVLAPWDDLLSKLDTVEKEMAYLGGVTLLQFADAWMLTWEAIGAGANVIEEAGKFVKGMLANVARTKAQMEVAEGVKALADGTWPPNPLAIQAAGKHFAAAALFSAIAGAIGGGRGGSRGGGAGGGAVTGDAAIRDQRDLQAARGTTTVILKRGYVNTTDPDFQDFLAEAITNAAGRRVEFVVE